MKICVITGSRAEYGLLRPLLKRLKASEHFTLQIIACAGHLLESQGYTVASLYKEGFAPDFEVEMLLASNSKRAMSKAIGLGILSFTDAFDSLKPDAVLVLGDRFEILAAATAALALDIPLIHLEGGQVTQGAVDESIRHAVSKMARIHFTAAESYRQRLIRMGEDPKCVFNVGATGLEELESLSQKPMQTISTELGFDFSKPYVFVTLHSETAPHAPSAHDMAQKLCNALAKTSYNLVFTGSNADPGGDIINASIQKFVSEDTTSRFFRFSFGVENFLSTARHAACIVGNSSSGIIEIPSLGVPTLNIGERQKGRLRAPSVIDVDFETIENGLAQALSPAHRLLANNKENPLGKGETSKLMHYILAKIDFSALPPKGFHDAI